MSWAARTNWAGMSAGKAQLCLCKTNLSKNPLIPWLMTVCQPSNPLPIHSFPSSLLSIFRQQQIFIWRFTRDLCSPGCQQPRSFSAASRWFPGCTLPRFPPVEAAEHWDHTQFCSKGHVRAQNRADSFSTKPVFVQHVVSKTEAGVFVWL